MTVCSTKLAASEVFLLLFMLPERTAWASDSGVAAKSSKESPRDFL